MDYINKLKEILDKLDGNCQRDNRLVQDQLNNLERVIEHMELEQENENKIFRTRIEIIK